MRQRIKIDIFDRLIMSGVLPVHATASIGVRSLARYGSTTPPAHSLWHDDDRFLSDQGRTLNRFPHQDAERVPRLEFC